MLNPGAAGCFGISLGVIFILSDVSFFSFVMFQNVFVMFQKVFVT